MYSMPQNTCSHSGFPRSKDLSLFSDKDRKARIDLIRSCKFAHSAQIKMTVHRFLRTRSISVSWFGLG
jgi:hypothetical protein